jgi:carboxypeptidase Q
MLRKFLLHPITLHIFTAAYLTIALFASAQEDAHNAADPDHWLASHAAQPDKEDIDLVMYGRIRQEGFNHSHVMQFAGALFDGIGPRLTGSPNMEKANAWARDTLAAIGLVNAHLEDWGDFGMGWQHIDTWARMISPDPSPIWMQALPWSPSTNGPVTGEVVYMPADDAASITNFKGNLAGKIVLLGEPHPLPDLTEPLFRRYTPEQLAELETANPGALPREATGIIAEYRRAQQVRPLALKRCEEEGCLAILLPTRDTGAGGGTGLIVDDNTMNLVRDSYKPANRSKVPSAVVMIEHYSRLKRLVDNHVPVTVQLNIDTRFTSDHAHGFNTIAEIPGTDPALKDQVVMVGGHLDSWIAGTGATDDGAGSIIAMEAMRILKALDIQPHRTIRIGLWSGEEQGHLGSLGYVKSHYGNVDPLALKKEWENLDAYYNIDTGGGKLRGISTQQNYAVIPIFRQWIAPLGDLGVTAVSGRSVSGEDHESFDALGLPGFNFIQDPMDYGTRSVHTNMDTYDRLHPLDLEQAAIVEAIFLYNTSQRAAMLPRKPLPHPESESQRNAPIPGIYPGAPQQPQPH